MHLPRNCTLLGIVILCALTTSTQAQPKPDKVVNYQKATPEEAAAAIADAQSFAKDVQSKVGVTLVELQTDHFIVFTDWDAREHNFLKKNVEAAYTAVSRQFELSPKDNIFIGKLPIFMFDKQAKFMEFSQKIGGRALPRDVAGYYVGDENGYGFMCMWKPDVKASGGNQKAAEERWARTLTHEFTHAFVARYRTNRRIPRWLNEGVAEVVAQGAFPDNYSFRFAKDLAGKKTDIKNIFDDSQMPGADMYPVMMTLVQALAKESPKKFLKYFNTLKDGGDPEKTLQEMYKVDYAGLETAWRAYMKNTK